MDGFYFPIPFQNMKVDVPILSVQKYVRLGWRFVFDEAGSYMEHKASGTVLNFIEAEGACWLKLKVGKPGPMAHEMRSGFIRPGMP